MSEDDDLKKYQVDPAFPPDKAETWASSTDEDHWVLSHNSLRGEIEELTKCVDALKEQRQEAGTDKWQMTEWKFESLRAVWNYHRHHVGKHHESEETILEPFVATRAKFPVSVEGGHKVLVDQLEKIQDIFEVDHGHVDKSLDEFFERFAQYKETLLQHLKEEETICLPIIRNYFTYEEFKTTGKAMGKDGGHAGSFVYYIGEEKFRNETMKSMGIPFFVWHLAFSKALTEYQRDVLCNVKAIQENQPPAKAEPGKWFGIF